MNELTKKMQEIMVPKAALIAYEYRESAYATGKNYLELRPINKAGRMEAGIPVTYEFMNALVESYSDERQNVPHGRLPSNMLWCDTRKGHEKYIWYNPPGKRRMFFKDSLNIKDGVFHLPGVVSGGAGIPVMNLAGLNRLLHKQIRRESVPHRDCGTLSRLLIWKEPAWILDRRAE